MPPQADLSQIEQHIQQNLAQFPAADHLEPIWKELGALKATDGANFQQDLTKINKDLHDKGFLPEFQINEAPKSADSADGFAIAPTVDKIEKDIKRLAADPKGNMDEVYKELAALQKSEDPAQFLRDVSKINQDLNGLGQISINPFEKYQYKWMPTPPPSDNSNNQPSAPSEDQWIPPNGTSPNEGGPGGGPRGVTGNGNFGGDGPGAGGSGNPGGGGASGPGNFDGYTGTVSGDGTQQAILDACNADLNHAMWKQIDGGASGGNEGCAASVSAVLNQSGAANVHEMECHHLQSALEAQGWSQTTHPQPGDVVIGYGGLSTAHTGIVGANGKVFDNHSSSGTWQQDDLSYFKRWNQVVFLHKDSTPAAPAAPSHTPAPAKGH